VVDHEALFKRVMDIHNNSQWDRLGEVFTDDYVEEFPQSGEVFRGLENARAQRALYPMKVSPGNVDMQSARLAASEQKWVMTPMFTAVRVEGSGDLGTAIFRVRYPDGSVWWNIHMYHVRGGKLDHSTAYFAPEFEPPDWRAPFRDSPAG
jgi:hypothetical protein